MNHKKKMMTVIFLIIVTLGASAVVYSQDWPMFGHDPELTGYSSSDGPLVGPFQWSFTVGGAVISSPVVVDGKVYVGSSDGLIYCLNADTGAKIWEYITDGPVPFSPAVVDNKVFIGSTLGDVYCLNADTGALIWHYTSGPPFSSSPVVLEVVANAEYLIYLGFDDGGQGGFFTMYRVESTTIYDVNYYTLTGAVTSAPAVTDSGLYIGAENYAMHARFTPNEDWEYITDGPVTSSPTVVDDRIFFGSEDSKVYCLDTDDGDLIWEYTTEDMVTSSPAVADGEVYIGSNDGKVYCLDAYTGAKIWEYRTDYPVSSSPAVAGGEVYIGSENGKVYCLDADTGDVIWEYTIGGAVTSSPAVADGKVYISSEDGNVICLGSTPEERIYYLEAENEATWIKREHMPGTRIHVFFQGEYVISPDETTHVWQRTFHAQPWSEYSDYARTEFLTTNNFHFFVNDEEVPLTRMLTYNENQDSMTFIWYRVFPPGYFASDRNNKLRGVWDWMQDGIWQTNTKTATLRVKK
jgi:outer membrane protein assembly factor BamB